MTDRWLGGPVAERLRGELRRRVETATAQGRPAPTLASVHRGGATPFAVYLRQQRKAAEEVGVRFVPRELPGDGGRRALESELRDLDADPGIHGVLVEHPLPEPWGFSAAIDQLRAEKDTDGVGTSNLGRLAAGRAVQTPAVVEAAIRLAVAGGAVLSGRRVGVVGRSETVGRPLALRLLDKQIDATVTVAHSRTGDLAGALAGCEVIFACAGRPGLLDRSNVPRGAAVVDVGLTPVPDPGAPGGRRLLGDANAEALDGWASALTPVPGGVGPVTVACLMENVVRGWSLLERIP